jgi:hypothetical protein
MTKKVTDTSAPQYEEWSQRISRQCERAGARAIVTEDRDVIRRWAGARRTLQPERPRPLGPRPSM